MKVHNHEEVIIFAVNQATQQEDLDLIKAYTSSDINIKPLIGCWDGEEENSYLVSLTDWLKHEESFKALMWNTDQDAVLWLDNQRVAHLLSKSYGYDINNEITIGVFQGVSEHTATKQMGWTKDTLSGQYYCVF